MSRTDIDTNKIVIFGRSLGGAVAISLASNELYLDKAFALIVENTFTSIPSMANQLVMNGLSKLPYFCFRNKVNLGYMSLINVCFTLCFSHDHAQKLIAPKPYLVEPLTFD